MNITNNRKTDLFRTNLKTIRKKRGLSLTDLSKITGISIRMLSYYELHTTNPPYDKIELIAKGLKVSINELLGESKLTEQSKKNKNDELINIDTRTLQKVRELLSLPPQDRSIVYSLISSMIERRKIEKRKLQKSKS